MIRITYNQYVKILNSNRAQVYKHTPRIELLHYHSLNYDYKHADIVFVANFVTPKLKVLDRIAATAKNGIQVLVRTPVSFGKMIYESAIDGRNPRLTLIKEGAINSYFIKKLLILQKLEL